MKKLDHVLLLLVFLFLQMSSVNALEKKTIDELKTNFLNPPMDCRPHTRWWWPGNPVTKKEIAWELEQMQTHGLGGVEQITMGEVYKKGNIPYMSDEFLEMIKHTVKEAKRLGMEVSLNFGGPGWIVWRGMGSPGRPYERYGAHITRSGWTANLSWCAPVKTHQNQTFLGTLYTLSRRK